MVPKVNPMSIKGKMVSRSTYQKVVEENKRMRKDLKIIVTSSDEKEVHKVFLKWQNIFMPAGR